MKKFFFLLPKIILLALLSITATEAYAAPAQQVVSGHMQARFNILPAAERIGEQIQALVTGNENGEIEPQETFGTRVLGLIISFFEMMREDGVAFITNFAALPQVETWFNQQVSDPALRDRWIQTLYLLVLVVGGAFAAGWLADLLLLPARRRIRRLEPDTVAARLGALATWLFLSLIPVLLFLGTALVILNQNDPVKLVRFIVMTVVYALALLRLIRLVIRFLLAPNTPALRFIPITSEQARYAQSWLFAFSAVMVFGYFSVDLARLVRIPAEAITAFNSIIGLIVVVMTITVIVQKRAFVSTFIRGDLSAARRGLTLWQSLRLWLARSWHVLAIAYLVIGYVVTMLSAGSGFAIMQRGTILTLIILFAMRMAFYLITRISPKHYPKDVAATFGLLRPVMQFLLRIVVWTGGVIGIAAAWGADVISLITSAWGQRILGSAFTIASTIVLVVLAYEWLHTSIERKLNPRDKHGNVVEANARVRTLLPMVRYAAMVILAVIAGMVILSELGINTAPLLAGAGVIGVAVGFGSQTLVKDFLTGLFILLEDSIAVGDLVQIGDNKGTVEGITIRTVRLRDRDGSLHVIPFSSINSIINRSKQFSYAFMTLNVAYDSDLTFVMNVMRDEGEKLRADNEYRHLILEPIEVLGVESLGDSAINVSCRIKTAPGKQQEIKRVYLLRIKQRFDKEKIEIPFPTVTQVRKG